MSSPAACLPHGSTTPRAASSSPCSPTASWTTRSRHRLKTSAPPNTRASPTKQPSPPPCCWPTVPQPCLCPPGSGRSPSSGPPEPTRSPASPAPPTSTPAPGPLPCRPSRPALAAASPSPTPKAPPATSPSAPFPPACCAPPVRPRPHRPLLRLPEPTGTPVATRTDSVIDFTSTPVDTLPAVWSATWSGTLTPTHSGLHRFSLLAAGTATLKINGVTVVTGSRGTRRFFLGTYDYPLQGTIDLAAGRTVSVELTYSNATADPGTSGLTLGWQPGSLIPAAVQAATKAEAAVVFVNRIAGEAMDHEQLALPADQNQLITAVAAANSRTIVVLNTDGPVAMPWLNDVEAVIQTWYGGRGMGTALAAVLFGDSDPSGRLPITFPADTSQGPGTTTATYPGKNGTVSYDEGIAIGYRYYDAKGQQPQFPFGHGLSYTTFAHGSPEASYSAASRTVTLSVTVTNSGNRPGTEVVQVYATLPTAAAAEPRRLAAFRKTTLAPGASRRLTFTIPTDDLTVWTSGTWSLVPGLYTFATARNSRAVTTQRNLTIG
ncbi:glycoside hydrolase family 3 C-terminal domain-containing protein [Streptomyces microflavus]